MKDRLRILHIVGGTATDWGGPSRVVREMARELGARGHAVTILSTDVAPGGRRLALGEPGQPEPDGHYHVLLATVDWPHPPYPATRFLGALWAMAKDFDVVHVHGVFSVPVSGAMALLRARGVPFVVRACGMLDAWSLRQGGVVKKLFYYMGEAPNLRAARAIQVSTAHEEAAVAALGLGVPIVRLPQGVAHGPAAPEVSPWPRPYVLFLGRVARKKGLVTLVSAVTAGVGLGLDLVIVGPDERGHQAELMRWAAGKAVYFVGPERDAAKKAAWYAHAAAFVLASEDENFGITVIEAAQYGAPIVVSDQVGLAPDVLALDAGLVVPGEAKAVRRAIEAALARGRAGFRAGTERLAARFDWGAVTPELEALYRRVLSAAT